MSDKPDTKERYRLDDYVLPNGDRMIRDQKGEWVCNCSEVNADKIVCALNAPPVQGVVINGNAEIDSLEMALSTLVGITNMSDDKNITEMAGQCYLFFANRPVGAVISRDDVGVAIDSLNRKWIPIKKIIATAEKLQAAIGDSKTNSDVGGAPK